MEFLFSDKTGTLTQNEMIFKQFALDGEVYEESKGNLYKLGSRNSILIKKNTSLYRLLEILSLCHTVQLDINQKDKYQASSPDEMCFIEFCIKLGIVYEGDKKQRNNSPNKTRTVKYINERRNFEILQILEFDSTRKRMSIILRDLSSQKIILFCKGADSYVLPKCIAGDIQSCEASIKSFGQNGWRTLALAYREFTEQEYSSYELKLTDAYNDIINRNERVAGVFEDLESNLILVGATAIEDKLQDDVANTLEALRISGIKIWVLTGDKTETAINISNSCKHFSESMFKLFLTDLKDKDQIANKLKQYRKK